MRFPPEIHKNLDKIQMRAGPEYKDWLALHMDSRTTGVTLHETFYFWVLQQAIDGASIRMRSATGWKTVAVADIVGWRKNFDKKHLIVDRDFYRDLRAEHDLMIEQKAEAAEQELQTRAADAIVAEVLKKFGREVVKGNGLKDRALRQVRLWDAECMIFPGQEVTDNMRLRFINKEVSRLRRR